MAFDIINFYRDHGISSVSEGHKHCQPGWVQSRCPFCTGNPGYHLGFNLADNYYNCWRCGFKPITQVIQAYLNCHFIKAKELATKYGNRFVTRLEKRERKWASRLKFPPATMDLRRRHILYLRERGFPAAQIIREWGLKATGASGPYRLRIIAPITFNDRLVSYQGRDITGKAKLKYKACAMNDEVIHHKKILYGLDQASGDSCLLVEGITDVWKLGPGTIAGFGIKMKYAQLRTIAEKYRRVFLMFDEGGDDLEEEIQAEQEIEKIGNELSLMGVDVEQVTDIGASDPGELDFDKARELKRKLLS